MQRRSLATLALLVAVPAGILTTVAASSAGAQNVTHVRVVDAGINRAVPVSRPVPVNRHKTSKSLCVTVHMNHAHTAATLRCKGTNISAGIADTAAAQAARTGVAPAVTDGHWVCVQSGPAVLNPDGSVTVPMTCRYVSGGGGGGS